MSKIEQNMSLTLARMRQRDKDELEKNVYFSICNNDTDKLKELIKVGMEVNITFYGSNQWQKTAMHLCCEKGHIECASILYEAGASLNIKDAWYHNPLMYSIFSERSDVLQFLLERGCDPDEHDRFGCTALHFAVSHTTTECMKLLLEYGADVDNIDEMGRTPLWVAAAEDGHLDVIKCLIKAGADINHSDRREKRTPLHAAIRHTKKDTVEYMQFLIESGAEVNTVDDLGQSPMTSLIQNGSSTISPISQQTLNMVNLLLDIGFDVDLSRPSAVTNRCYGTALKAAVIRGSQKLVKLLLNAGANPDIPDGRNVTPLIWSAYHNQPEICALLLSANCRMDTVGRIVLDHELFSATAFHCAILMEHFKIAQLLVLAGYDCKFEKYLFSNEDVPRTLVENFEIWGELRDAVMSTRLLIEICRDMIRKQVGLGIHGKVQYLSLPARLKQYILLEDLLTTPS